MPDPVKRRVGWMAALTCFVLGPGCDSGPRESAAAHAADAVMKDRYTLVGEDSFLSGYEPVAASGNVNVVVEIPAGTNQKWEVDESTGEMRWDFKHGSPQVIEYLAYPGNYGMIPRTLLPSRDGGDGDPLDIVVLGAGVSRGSVVEARVIGVLKILDRGDRDDKLIAVMPGTPLGSVTSLDQLDSSFAGITDILETWFLNYKGPGKIVSEGFAGGTEAQRILKQAMDAYARHVSEGTSGE